MVRLATYHTSVGMCGSEVDKTTELIGNETTTDTHLLVGEGRSSLVNALTLLQRAETGFGGGGRGMGWAETGFQGGTGAIFGFCIKSRPI